MSISKDGKLDGKLTVFFAPPFWVGIFERTENGTLSVSKVTFGAEPKDYEVYAFVLENYDALKFSDPMPRKPALEAGISVNSSKMNPKRLQRKIRKSMVETRGRTKAQEAVQQARDAEKIERKKCSAAEKRIQEKMAFEHKQIKKKQKKRGH